MFLFHIDQVNMGCSNGTIVIILNKIPCFWLRCWHKEGYTIFHVYPVYMLQRNSPTNDACPHYVLGGVSFRNLTWTLFLWLCFYNGPPLYWFYSARCPSSQHLAGSGASVVKQFDCCKSLKRLKTNRSSYFNSNDTSLQFTLKSWD